MSDKIPEFYKIESPLTDLINVKKISYQIKKQNLLFLIFPELGQVNLGEILKEVYSLII
ncbi:MAG: hypothetical protein CM1200mP37_7640 [Chloroflexota bacterium]|nr:MAG: hypothetical protein CM1200mP37_7640 [Chloroflexota bacterium]